MRDAQYGQSDIQQRLDQVAERFIQGYHSIGHSVSHPYLYFVYDPDAERLVQMLLPHLLQDTPPFVVHQVDLLSIAIESLAGQEERRQQLLNDPWKGANQAQAILNVWARETKTRVEALLQTAKGDTRPTLVLSNTAALHPVGNPSTFLEALYELQHPRHPSTSAAVPTLVCVPGFYSAQTSRCYQFLSRGHPVLPFYYGESL